MALVSDFFASALTPAFLQGWPGVCSCSVRPGARLVRQLHNKNEGLRGAFPDTCSRCRNPSSHLATHSPAAQHSPRQPAVHTCQARYNSASCSLITTHLCPVCGYWPLFSCFNGASDLSIMSSLNRRLYSIFLSSISSAFLFVYFWFIHSFFLL